MTLEMTFTKAHTVHAVLISEDPGTSGSGSLRVVLVSLYGSGRNFNIVRGYHPLAYKLPCICAIVPLHQLLAHPHGIHETYPDGSDRTGISAWTANNSSIWRSSTEGVWYVSKT
jgi:hypothetical protein